jgi:hypothetical protein
VHLPQSIRKATYTSSDSQRLSPVLCL